MGIAQAIALGWKILGVVLTLLGIANDLNAKPLAEEGHPLEIQTAVLATGQFLVDPVLGIPRVISNQAALLAALGSVQTALLAAIGTPQQSGVAVTLPSVAPSWYTSPASAADVWLYPIGSQGYIAQSLLGAAGAYAIVLGQNASIAEARGSLIAFEGDLNDFNHPPPADGPVVVNPQNIRLTDDRLSWLTREFPNAPHGWDYDSFSDTFSFVDSAGHQNWRCLVTQEWFLRLQRIAVGGAVAQAVVAPVWPGIAGVTLGIPVALSPTCVVTGPMHGVIIEITSAAPRQLYYVYGGMQGYHFVGGLQFVDDNGDAERIQGIDMQHQIIVPKAMSVAASCSVRTDSAAVGTVTPFVIN